MRASLECGGGSPPPTPGEAFGAFRSRLPVVTIVLLIHAGLLLGAARTNFVVVDEVGHVPAGIAHWENRGFSLYRVNPPLGRMLATLPVLLVGPKSDYRRLNESPALRSDWDVGRDFCRANGPRYFDLVRLARLSGIAWSLGCALVIYRWSRALYGEGAGRLGVALWCFDPTILTFGHLVIPDLPSAAAGVLASYAFWRYLRAPSHRSAAVAGVLMGLAQLTKFTLLILYVLWALVWLLDRRPWRREPADRPGPAIALRDGPLIVLLSLAVINLGYGFRDSFRPLGQFDFVSRTLAGETWSPGRTFVLGTGSLGNRFRGHWLGRLPVPVPAEYLQGIDAQRKDFEKNYPSYLRGEWRNRGWWYYYLYALGVKEPLGTLGLVAWGLALTLFGHPSSARRSDEMIPLLLAGGILVFVSAHTGINHHMRYILPIFPFVAVSTSKLAYFLRPGRRWGWLVVALLSWSIASGLRVYPHTLSYFNEAAGGPERGHDHLLDSNIDWGQDLFALKDWLDHHPEARPLELAFFHFLDPRLFGIDYRIPPLRPGFPDQAKMAGPRPGYFAVSVNFLRGSTFRVPNDDGGWTWVPRRDSFAHFRDFRPIARAGYSIYIYHITSEQADAARRANGLPPWTEPQAGATVPVRRP